VDGGTTKTIALAADDRGRILGAGRGGNSNWTGADVEIPMAVVADAVRQALDQAGLSGGQIGQGAFALAGADWPEDHVRRETFLSRAGIANRVVVMNDTFAGLRAGISQPWGAVVIAGTGANAAVITPDGERWAYGYYADEGGGGTIGRWAIEAVLREEDGRGAQTALTPVVLNTLGYASADELLHAIIAGQLPHRAGHRLCPLVFLTANGGDAVACDILARDGRLLAEYATGMLRRFRMAALAFELVLSGSVFKGKCPVLIDTLTAEVHRVAPRARIVRVGLEPAAGAVLLAYDALGITVTDEIAANLRATFPDASLFRTVEAPLSEEGDAS
jgi:N-acetylglucosamine kinase-like BadF-type ATPase